MNPQSAAEKLLSLLGSRARLIRTYGWQPVFVLWALMLGTTAPLLLFFPVQPGSLPWQHLPLLAFPPFLAVLRIWFPDRFTRLSEARLLGLWSLSWAAQTFMVLVLPWTGLCMPDGALMLALSLFLLSMVLTGLLKQLRALMVLGLLSWLALMVLWVLVPPSLRQVLLSASGCLAAALASLPRPRATGPHVG